MKKALIYTVALIVFEIAAYYANYGLVNSLGLGRVWQAAGDFSKSLPDTPQTGLYTVIQVVWIIVAIAGIVIYTLFLAKAILGRKEPHKAS